MHISICDWAVPGAGRRHGADGAKLNALSELIPVTNSKRTVENITLTYTVMNIVPAILLSGVALIE